MFKVFVVIECGVNHFLTRNGAIKGRKEGRVGEEEGKRGKEGGREGRRENCFFLYFTLVVAMKVLGQIMCH